MYRNLILSLLFKVVCQLGLFFLLKMALRIFPIISSWKHTSENTFGNFMDLKGIFLKVDYGLFKKKLYPIDNKDISKFPIVYCVCKF